PPDPDLPADRARGRGQVDGAGRGVGVQAVHGAGGDGGLPGGGAALRRQWIHGGVPGGAALPGREGAADLRRDRRDPGVADRAEPARRVSAPANASRPRRGLLLALGLAAAACSAAPPAPPARQEAPPAPAAIESPAAPSSSGPAVELVESAPVETSLDHADVP